MENNMSLDKFSILYILICSDMSCPDVLYTVFRSYCSSVVLKFTQHNNWASKQKLARHTGWKETQTVKINKLMQRQCKNICYVWNTDWPQIINWIHICINTQIKCFLEVNALFTVTQRQKEHVNGNKAVKYSSTLLFLFLSVFPFIY